MKQSIGEPRGFVGDLTTARTGFFFKRDQAPLLPKLAMRGSIEAKSNLDRRLHLVTALGLEKPNSGITTMLQASLIPAPAGSGLPDNAQLNLFFVGNMEPLSQAFADDMSSLGIRCGRISRASRRWRSGVRTGSRRCSRAGRWPARRWSSA